MKNVTKNDVIQSFHSHPMSKHIIPEGLENQFFMNALAEYELDVKKLNYDEISEEFQSETERSVVYTLGMLMYVNYLTRELSRIEKLSGFHGKDIQMTGSDESKRITYSDLQLEINRVQELLHKQKRHCYNN